MIEDEKKAGKRPEMGAAPGGHVLIPYLYQPETGDWNIPDAVFADAWSRMEAEGTVRRVFPSGSARTVGDWLGLVKSPANAVHVQVRAGEARVSWVAWVNGFTDNRCFGHFVGFGNSENSRERLRQSLRWWFGLEKDGAPLFDLVLGLIPETNRPALNLARRVGIERIGVIPTMLKDVYRGGRVGGVLLYAERGRFIHG